MQWWSIEYLAPDDVWRPYDEYESFTLARWHAIAAASVERAVRVLEPSGAVCGVWIAAHKREDR